MMVDNYDVIFYDVTGGDVIMHRTQVLLEDRHYAFLKKKSEEENKSISQVLREILDRYARRSKIYSLSSIAGIAEDSECYGRDHDKWLYGKK
jgi:predicted CopG family antitoxin